MANTSPNDPIALLVARYESNEHQPATHAQSRKKKGWAGFEGKTLWDWLHLLGILLIPLMAPFLISWFNSLQNATNLELARKLHENDQAVSLDQQRATILNEYLNKMGEIDEVLKTSPLAFAGC